MKNLLEGNSGDKLGNLSGQQTIPKTQIVITDEVKSIIQGSEQNENSNPSSIDRNLLTTEGLQKEFDETLTEDKNERKKIIAKINTMLVMYKDILRNSITELQELVSSLLSQVQDYEDSIFTTEKIGHAKESFAIYKGKSFELDNPSDTQKRVIRIFQAFLAGDERLVNEGNLFNPKKGMFLHGKPGRGKTHTTMVFVLELLKVYKSQFEKMFGDFQSQEEKVIDGYVSSENISIKDLKEKYNQLLNLEFKSLAEKVKQFKQQLQSIPQISSLLHIVHNDKIKIRLQNGEKKSDLVHELATYPYLIIDELYIKDGEDEYADFFKELVEARYQSGKFGMFITSNMEPRATLEGVDPKRFDMIFSRLNEMNMIANLDDQEEDYRHKSTGKLFDSF